ncbi:MAG: hypothetical protein ACLQUY_15250 [Ktedonobacterales bacterium]
MNDPSSPGELALLEKLAVGLLASPGDPRGTQPRLFLGKIPESLPVEVPVPDQTRVLGTLARSETNVEILLESDLTPEDIRTFYRTRLTALGWHEADFGSPHQGGFLHSRFGRSTNIVFCQVQGGAGLTLNLAPPESTPTTVRLTLSLDRDMNPCAREAMRRGDLRHHTPHDLIPALVPPQGAQQRSGGGGGSSNEVHTTATVITALGLDAVAQHYGDQLSQAGWKQTDVGTSGPLAWHTWQFTSDDQEPWTGLFFALKTPGKLDDYFLHVRAAWSLPESNPTFTGWMSYGPGQQRLLGSTWS